MAQPKPVQQAANVGAMDLNVAAGKLNTQFIQRQIAVLSHARADKVAVRLQLAAAHMALSSRRKRAGLALEDHQIVDKPRRNPEMPRRLAMRIAFFNKRNNSRTKLNRM